MNKKHFLSLILFIVLFCSANLQQLFAQTSMTNIPGRNTISLNGEWNAVIDPFDIGIGEWKSLWKDLKPVGKHDFYEYSFEGGPVLDVPGDFNSQIPELKYFESSVWYKKVFSFNNEKTSRVFINFGAVNYTADIYMNNKKIGCHEGGFTPFQFEISDSVREGENSLIVRTNNRRIKDGVPGLGFDWFNYGGITRDVNLVVTPASFIEDYFIQLKKGTSNIIYGWVKINGDNSSQKIILQIPELKINNVSNCNKDGIAIFEFPADLKLWSPENPKLYKVSIISESDTISEKIGFRLIEVKGTDIFLNGSPVFLKGVNIHEEIPQRKGRAYSESDATMLLNWAKELGCNFVRLAHYPHNEYMVRLADKLGLMIWSEIPVYQGIDFANPIMTDKMKYMLKEMVSRDKNRCSIIIWSMSNETYPSADRDKAIIELAHLCRSLDSTRLISSALNAIRYEGNTAIINDTIINAFDVMAVNEYYGWYKTWPSEPGNILWKSDFNKPLIMSEFGGEALYGNHDSLYMASTWSEEYQEQIYKDQVKMFENITFLKGTCPWILADFQSPGRMHPVYQNGWNRKGLISDTGFKKKAWYIIKQFYDEE